MSLELPLVDDFGPALADGARAYQYRIGRIDPYVNLVPEIILDFTGVRSANSSFVNALISGAIEQHGERVLNVLTFKGCSPTIRVLIGAAISLGLTKAQERAAAR